MFFQDSDELARPGFLALKSRTFHLCCSNSMGLLDMNVTQRLFACSTLQLFFCIKSELCEIKMVRLFACSTLHVYFLY